VTSATIVETEYIYLYTCFTFVRLLYGSFVNIARPQVVDGRDGLYNRSWVDQNLNFVKINVTEYILVCYAYSEHVLTRKAITQCRTF
jgi:hypothetical protein